MAQGRPYQAYQKTSVGTSNQKQLILMLFDGMNRFMNLAIKGMEEEDFEVSHHNLHKVGKILMELLSTLREDRGGDVARNLKRIYVFSYEQIVIANLKKDPKLVVEVQNILGDIREGFKEISQQKKSSTVMGSQNIRVTG